MKDNKHQSAVNSAVNSKTRKAPRQTVSMRYLEMSRNRADKLARKLAEVKRELTMTKAKLKFQETDRTVVMTATIRDLRTTISERDLIIARMKDDLASVRIERTKMLAKIVTMAGIINKLKTA